jgi:HMG (high mobility group) box
VRRLLEDSLRDERQDSSQNATGTYLGNNYDSHFLHIHGGTQGNRSLMHPAAAALPSSITGATAPYYQNLLQSMNNEAEQLAISRSVANYNVEKDILDDLYKIISSADQPSSEYAEAPQHQSRVDNGYNQYSTQLTDNYDMSSFAGAGETDIAATWLALQQRNQLQSHGYSEIANSTNRRMEQLAMLPNHQARPIGLQGGQATGYGAPFSGADPSSLLAAIFAEPMASIDPPAASNDSRAPPQSTATKATGSNSKNQVAANTTGGPKSKQPKTGQQQLPFRALSAYNFFFRDERERIINGGEYELSAAKKQQLLTEHWFRDRTVKRRHRKTHGKISFTTLSKVISQGWRDLPEHKKAFYREVAAEDLDRYQRELDQSKSGEAKGGVAGTQSYA